MQSINWKPSCKSEYSCKDNSFIFKTKKGVPGTCPNDDKPGYKNGELWYTHRERCETRSDNLLIGNYIWTADVEIDCLGYSNSCLFQLHWPEDHKDNFIKLAINSFGNFTINNNPRFDAECTKSFSLRINIECRKDFTNVDYFSNNQYIGSYRKLSNQLPFMKFGIYTPNSPSDITQTYNNVKVEYNDGA